MIALKSKIIVFFLIAFFLSIIQIYGQQENFVWQKIDNPFLKLLQVEESKKNELNESFFYIFYKNFISKYDGDNCPFSETCSAFFANLYRKENFFYAFFLTIDRSLRELNIFELRTKYGSANGKQKKLVDPHYLYLKKKNND